MSLEAVEVVKSLRPDVVLMDISMPIMNGIDATNWLKKKTLMRRCWCRLCITTVNTSWRWCSRAQSAICWKRFPLKNGAGDQNGQSRFDLFLWKVTQNLYTNRLLRPQSVKNPLSRREEAVLKLRQKGSSKRDREGVKYQLNEFGRNTQTKH